MKSTNTTTTDPSFSSDDDGSLLVIGGLGAVMGIIILSYISFLTLIQTIVR